MSFHLITTFSLREKVLIRHKGEISEILVITILLLCNLSVHIYLAFMIVFKIQSVCFRIKQNLLPVKLYILLYIKLCTQFLPGDYPLDLFDYPLDQLIPKQSLHNFCTGSNYKTTIFPLEFCKNKKLMIQDFKMILIIS